MTPSNFIMNENVGDAAVTTVNIGLITSGSPSGQRLNLPQVLNSDVLQSLGAQIFHMEAQDTTERQNTFELQQILNGGKSTELPEDKSSKLNGAGEFMALNVQGFTH